MKKIKKENGWDEVTTKKIRFTQVKREFLKCKVWQESKRDHTSKSCDYCSVKWDDKPPDEWTAIVMPPPHGNKVLCMNCFDNVFELKTNVKQ